MPQAKKTAIAKTPTRRRNTKTVTGILPDPASQLPEMPLVYYGRNLHTVPATLRTKDGESLNFMPRGMRGDMLLITDEQLRDPLIRNNVDLVIELVSEQVYLEVLAAQHTNQQSYRRELHDLLRDPNNQPYANEPTVAIDHGHVAPTASYPIDQATGEIYTSYRTGVGPRIVTDLPGADPEYAALLGADQAARNGEDLVERLKGRKL